MWARGGGGQSVRSGTAVVRVGGSESLRMGGMGPRERELQECRL